jgi:hypothetical protein
MVEVNLKFIKLSCLDVTYVHWKGALRMSREQDDDNSTETLFSSFPVAQQTEIETTISREES